MKNKIGYILGGVLFILLFIVIRRKILDSKTPPQYFKADDINSRGTPPPPEYEENVKTLLSSLNAIQAYFYSLDPSHTVSVTSSYRTPQHNTEVGGVSNSYHLTARAADIQVHGLNGEQIAEHLKYLIDNNFIPVGGVGAMTTAAHFDNRGEKKFWRYTSGSGAGTYSQPWKSSNVYLDINTSFNKIDI